MLFSRILIFTSVIVGSNAATAAANQSESLEVTPAFPSIVDNAATTRTNKSSSNSSISESMGLNSDLMNATSDVEGTVAIAISNVTVSANLASLSKSTTYHPNEDVNLATSKIFSPSLVEVTDSPRWTGQPLDSDDDNETTLEQVKVVGVEGDLADDRTLLLANASSVVTMPVPTTTMPSTTSQTTLAVGSTWGSSSTTAARRSTTTATPFWAAPQPSSNSSSRKKSAYDHHSDVTLQPPTTTTSGTVMAPASTASTNARKRISGGKQKNSFPAFTDSVPSFLTPSNATVSPARRRMAGVKKPTISPRVVSNDPRPSLRPSSSSPPPPPPPPFPSAVVNQQPTAIASSTPLFDDVVSVTNRNDVSSSPSVAKTAAHSVGRKVINAEMLGKKPVAPANMDDDSAEDRDEEDDEDAEAIDIEQSLFMAPTQANPLVYFDFRRQCPEEYSGDVWWNRTYGGVIAIRFCPDGYTGKVYRMCYYGGTWGDVDFSECRVQQLIKLKHLLYYHVHKNLTEGFHSLADELLGALLRYRLRSVDDYLESLDSLNIIINARVSLDFDVGQDFKYLKTILKISDILFSRFDNKWSFPQEQQEMVTMKMVQVLHGMTHFGNLVAEGVKRSSRSVVVFTDYPHIGLEARVIRGDQDYRVAPPETGSSVHLPGRMYKVMGKGASEKYVVVTTWYTGLGQSLHEDAGVVSSAVFATSVHPGHDIHLMAGPVTVTLRINEKMDEDYYPECGYLRRTYNKSSLWSQVGCSVTQIQGTSVTCVCHHMTNIAVISRHRHHEGHLPWKPMSLIVMIGCGICLVALFSTIIAHVHVLRYDSSESSLILLNLLLAMAASQVVFMGGIQATSNREICEGVSIVLHYLYLVSSFWLLSHGIHVYLSTKNLKDSAKISHIRDYCLLSWVAPIILVVITFAVNPYGYEIRRYCWLSIERGMLLSYIVPIFCLIATNTTLMVLVLKHLFETQVAMKKSEIDKARISVRAGVILLPYFGVNWFLGVLAMENRSTEVFDTLFGISTAVQGFLVFLFFSVCQTEVRKAFRQFTAKVLRRRKSSDLKLRRSRRQRSKLDAEPLLITPDICDHQETASSTTNLAVRCLPSPEEPFVMPEEEVASLT